MAEAAQVWHDARLTQWVTENMWDKSGFFWYQRGRHGMNRISYMRWTQAGMYCALTGLLRVFEQTR